MATICSGVLRFPAMSTPSVVTPASHSRRTTSRGAGQRERVFRVVGLTWIAERSFAWLGRNRRLSKDYEYRVQTSEAMIGIAAIRLMLNRLVPA